MIHTDQSNCKVFQCSYGGSFEVDKATGVDQVNKAVEIALSRLPISQWGQAEVHIQPSCLQITLKRGPTVECRIRFLSFCSIFKTDARLCGLIQQSVTGTFACHVLKREPDATALCEAIKAACETSTDPTSELLILGIVGKHLRMCEAIQENESKSDALSERF
ncbi:hypothetical protein CRM22_000592 [Opisthorchis felineus]|uniref:PID domain-containing protein n=1 Tax=Opisthorchis felineus TaxID=147828 RepID=A0A4S2MKG9_OPIFE|nr:hypothetical protein CRM22_000592 [Opisthorchis felineus]